MKIIFLDIDGVLNLIPQGHDEFGGIFHKHFVDNLGTIIEQTDAKIVISSSWRYLGYDAMQRMWEMRDYPGEIYDITPVLNTPRGEEIEFWLQHNEVDNYVILDDDEDMLTEQMQNFVQTSNNQHHPDCIDIGYGLTKICSERAIQILNKK